MSSSSCDDTYVQSIFFHHLCPTSLTHHQHIPCQLPHPTEEQASESGHTDAGTYVNPQPNHSCSNEVVLLNLALSTCPLRLRQCPRVARSRGATVVCHYPLRSRGLASRSAIAGSVDRPGCGKAGVAPASLSPFAEADGKLRSSTTSGVDASIAPQLLQRRCRGRSPTGSGSRQGPGSPSLPGSATAGPAGPLVLRGLGGHLLS